MGLCRRGRKDTKNLSGPREGTNTAYTGPVHRSTPHDLRVQHLEGDVRVKAAHLTAARPTNLHRENIEANPLSYSRSYSRRLSPQGKPGASSTLRRCRPVSSIQTSRGREALH